MIEIYK